jgi:two-component sensor histidine kinase
MQARKASTDEMKGMLKESELRIRSMGLLHEKLYQSNSLSTVDFKSYVDTLSGQLLRMHTSEEQPDLDVDIDDVLLPLDTARPCGLIINELVSNSLKYAFNDGRKGRIAIKVSPTGESAYQLRVSDNGVGMKKMPVPGERRSSLGMSLVEMLVDQLNGAVEFRNGDGTTADIQFKETVYTNRM